MLAQPTSWDRLSMIFCDIVCLSSGFNCKPTLPVIGTLGFDQTLSFYSINLPQLWSMLCFFQVPNSRAHLNRPCYFVGKNLSIKPWRSWMGHKKNHKMKWKCEFLFLPLSYLVRSMNVKNTVLIISRQEEALLGCFLLQGGLLMFSDLRNSKQYNLVWILENTHY